MKVRDIPVGKPFLVTDSQCWWFQDTGGVVTRQTEEYTYFLKADGKGTGMIPSKTRVMAL